LKGGITMGVWNRKEDLTDKDAVSVKVKCKRLLRKLLIMSIFGLIYAGVGLLIALLIANRNNYNLQDVAFSTGCLIVILGLFMMMRGNPSGSNISGWGAKNVTAMNHWNLGVTLQERESTNYYNDFRNNAVTEFTSNRFSFVLGGVFLVVISILFL
jgi:type III secretory pathway component EscS